MNDVLPTQRCRRVLVIAYVFPPSGGAGVQRVTKFVKYLPDFDWDCSVLTVANPSVPLQDESLRREIPEATVIRRARTFEPGYALKKVVSAGSSNGTSKGGGVKAVLKSVVRSVGNAVLQPDAQVLWYPQAVAEGKRLLRELHHDCIFVTAPPFSTFLIGAELSRWSGLPLVLDYRDDWGISNRYQENRQKSRVSHWLQARQQRSVLKQSKAVIATTRRSAESLQEVVTASGSGATVSCLYNGFDADDFVGRKTRDERPKDRAVFRLAYVGTLWNLTSIEPVVEALRRLCEQCPEIGSRVELVLAGRRTGDQDAILDRLNGLPCRIVREDYVEHSRAIEIMRSADALCLLLSDVPEAGRVVPAKTFEYLALRQPILAVTPRGEVSELLADCPLACVHEPRDVEGIADFLCRGVEGLVPLMADKRWEVNRFERRELTRQLAGLLDEACGGPRAQGLEPRAKCNAVRLQPSALGSQP